MLTLSERWIFHCLTARGPLVWNCWVAWAFMCGVYIFCSGFLPQTEDMQVRLIHDSKLPVGVNVSMNGCLSLCVSLVMDWPARALAQNQQRSAPAPCGWVIENVAIQSKQKSLSMKAQSWLYKQWSNILTESQLTGSVYLSEVPLSLGKQLYNGYCSSELLLSVLKSLVSSVSSTPEEVLAH